MNYRINSELLPQFAYSNNKIDTGFTFKGKKVYRQIVETTTSSSTDKWHLIKTNVYLILNLFYTVTNSSGFELYPNPIGNIDIYYTSDGNLYEKHHSDYYNNCTLLLVIDFIDEKI